MAIVKLEDLNVWQEARELRKLVYQKTKTFPKEEKFILCKHMNECSRNVPGNIAEGFGRYHFQESIQFYRIARGSLTELKSDTYCAFDENYLTEVDFDDLVARIEKITKMLNSLISSTQNLKGFTSNSK